MNQRSKREAFSIRGRKSKLVEDPSASPALISKDILNYIDTLCSIFYTFCMTMGVYKITNTINKKSYIGSSINIENRWFRHKRDLCFGQHPNCHLQRSVIKYGLRVFIIEILENVIDKQQLRGREQHWIDTSNVLDPLVGYNMCSTADRPPNNKGRSFSDVHKQRISEGLRGRVFSEEHRKALSLSSLGKILSVETRDKIRAGNTGQKRSTLAKQHMRERVISQEHKDKIKQALTGRVLSESHKQALKEAWKRRKSRKGI